MGLKLEKTITNHKLEEITGEYWSILGWTQNKQTGLMGGQLELYTDEVCFEYGVAPIFNITFSGDLHFDYEDMAENNKNERQIIYAWIKDSVNGFSEAEDV